MHSEMTEKSEANTSDPIELNTKIVIIENDLHISELIRYNLETEGYKVLMAHDGENGYRLVMDEKPDLILLDLMLPKIDGIKICKLIRNSETLSATPVIIMTAKFIETDRIEGLEAGADDCMTKPFSIHELKARIKAVLRRTKSQATKNISKNQSS